MFLLTVNYSIVCGFHLWLSKNSNPYVFILISAPVEVIKCLELVLSNGVDVNLCDGKKRTPLHYAVEALTPHSTTDVVEFLLEQGANVLAKDEEGRIPLHYAFCKLQK